LYFDLPEKRSNNRPRKRFGYKTPTEIFAQKLNDLVTAAFIP
jgi:IS30 family transposase